MKRLLQLDGLRFIMIMVVTISHLEFLLDSEVVGTVYQNHIKNGGFAVDFFFMLSGFGIYYVSADKNLSYSLKNSVLYAINKIKKIYPIYIVSLMAAMLYQIPAFFKHTNNILEFLLEMVVHTIPCILLVQSITGMTEFSHAINEVCWFLSCLFICYMFCPLFVKYVNKFFTKTKVFIGLLTTIGFIMFFSFIAFQIDGEFYYKINDLYYGHPFIRCFYLLLGMFIARIVLKKNMRIKHNNLFEIIILCSYITYFVFRNTFAFNTNVIRLFDICITALFLFVFSFGGGWISNLLSKNIIVSLGNNSMYIFLFHYPVRMSIGIIDKYVVLHNYIGEWAYIVQILLIIVFTILAIYLCKKIQNYVRYKISFLFEYANKKLS